MPMKHLKTVAAAAAALLLPSAGFACMHDLDCGSGALCAKSAGAIYGTCVREVLPANPDERRTPLAGAAPTEKQQCMFDTDCGAGRACMKTSASAAGLCVKQ